MQGSAVLETAIGLMFVFATVSLVCSGIVEGLGNTLNKRGEYLLRGLRELLDIPPATPAQQGSQGTPGVAGRGGLLRRHELRHQLQRLSKIGELLRARMAEAEPTEVMPAAPLADLVLSHPIVAAMHRPTRPGWVGRSIGGLRRRRTGMNLASYLSAQTFAQALIDLLVPGGGAKATVAQIVTQVEKLDPKVPARDALLALLRDTSDSPQRFRLSLERWYDEHMARVSGWYKRWAQWHLLVVGAVLAAVMNVDSLRLGQSFYSDAPVRSAVVAQAVSAQGCPSPASGAREDCLARQREVLRDLSLPIGWDLGAAATDCRARDNGRECGVRADRWASFLWQEATGVGAGTMLLKLIGWLVTALAVSFGAPFWFDALGRLGSLRTAGRRPGENQPFKPR